MRVIHVVPAISETANGPTYTVVSLCEALIRGGVDVTLAAMDWSPISSKPDFARTFPMGFGPKRLGRSPEMLRWLGKETSTQIVDVIHSHGMWQMCVLYPAKAARKAGKNLVVSPRGALSTWAMKHGSWFKTFFWSSVQQSALARASCFHATAESEYADIRRLGFRQPVAIIPNGIDVPELTEKQYRGIRTVLFLGRLHPIKGIDILLESWAKVMDRFPRWQLLIAGTDSGYGNKSGYLHEMKGLASRWKLKRVHFVGALYGDAKLSAYRDADLFVLPSHSENFAVTVAEALAAGTPAIVTKGAPWSGLDTHRAGWWINVGVDSLVSALERAMAESPEDLGQRGRVGREWMIQDFSWATIGIRMAQTYRWLIDGGKTPSWVKTD
jgi:glycosyltransferase involved in cell wall biosynthesis